MAIERRFAGVVEKFIYRPAIIKWCLQYTYKRYRTRPDVWVERIYTIFFCFFFIIFFFFFLHNFTYRGDGNKKKILREKKLIPIFLEISSFLNSSSAFFGFIFFSRCCYSSVLFIFLSHFPSKKVLFYFISKKRSVGRLHQKNVE